MMNMIDIVIITITTIQIACFEISRCESGKESWRRKFASEHQIRNSVYIGKKLTFGDGGKICRDT